MIGMSGPVAWPDGMSNPFSSKGAETDCIVGGTGRGT